MLLIEYKIKCTEVPKVLYLIVQNLCTSFVFDKIIKDDNNNVIGQEYDKKYYIDITSPSITPILCKLFCITKSQVDHVKIGSLLCKVKQRKVININNVSNLMDAFFAATSTEYPAHSLVINHFATPNIQNIDLELDDQLFIKTLSMAILKYNNIKGEPQRSNSPMMSNDSSKHSSSSEQVEYNPQPISDIPVKKRKIVRKKILVTN